MSSRKFIRQTSGFSLVELLVVVAIILLISALAMPRFLDAQKAAYEAGVVSLLRTLQSDQESYRLGNGSYADNFTDLGLVGRGPTQPENFFTPRDETPLAALLPELGTFRVYAAQPQEPPAKTPQFGGQPKKRPGKNPGAPGTTGMEGGSGGGTGKGGQGGGAAGGGAGGKAPGKGPGAGGGGQPTGGGPQGGGGGRPPGKGAGGGAGGSGGLGGPSGTTTKTNVLVKHNYIFTLRRPTPTTWICTAAPVRDRIHSKFFFMDQTGVMRVESGKAANANSPQMDSKTR